MIVGDRLRALREQKKLSQGDIEKRTGLLRSYISRVENNHTVPAIETLEKMARAMEIPMYRLFCDDDEPPPHLAKRGSEGRSSWGDSYKDHQIVDRFRRLLSRMDENSRKLLLYMAQRMALRTERRRNTT